MQLDVGGDSLVAEAAHDIVETVRRAVQIGIVNLVGVARENDFRAGADAGDDGFDFERREVQPISITPFGPSSRILCPLRTSRPNRMYGSSVAATTSTITG